MPASEGTRSAGAKFAIRLAALGVVAVLGVTVQAVMDNGKDTTRDAAPSSGQSTAPATPGTGEDPSDEADADPSAPEGDQSDGAVPDGGVPSGVTGGIGDDVGVHTVQVLATRRAGTHVPAAADIAGVTTSGQERSSGVARWAREHGWGVHSTPTSDETRLQDIIVWRTEQFALVAAGNEYGTRSLRTASGLEARRIVWVTVRHHESGTPISYILARLEPGTDSATRAANVAYGQRVDSLRRSLSRTSTVIVAHSSGERTQVTVPEGNAHDGVVLAVRDRSATRHGMLARLSLQAPRSRR